MRLPRPRFTVLQSFLAVEVVAVLVWFWACFFAGLDNEKIAAWFFMGIFFGLPALGISALFVVASQVLPHDLPPPESTSTKIPQFKIGWLMLAIAIAAVAFALMSHLP